MSAKKEYRHNHYVPEWYQRRFFLTPDRNQKLFYLSLCPKSHTDRSGNIKFESAITHRGPKSCFAQENLYTTGFGNFTSTDIEKFFFGRIDDEGRTAVDFFAQFAYKGHPNAFQSLITYMCTQRMRTPRGLQWLASQEDSRDNNRILRRLQQLKNIFGAIWSECVWSIADASNSSTKFIISDQPVTLYNRACPPDSLICSRFFDPDIRYNATHTIFPLSFDKVLLLTNLSWVRNPYQCGIGFRPNPAFGRDTIFNWTEIQTTRLLTELEVTEINFILKSRAYQFIAAAKEEWLFPEKSLGREDWSTFGEGYLLMPDPRSVGFSRQVFIGFKGGGSVGYDEYGLRPWQDGYNEDERADREWKTFHRFRGEFARLFGQYRRGRTFEFGRLDNEQDSDQLHAANLAAEQEFADSR